MNNLFGNIPDSLPEELFETLASSGSVLVERIVSRGHASPASGWYDQAREEFVVLLAGGARIEFADGACAELKPGDWLNIPARRKHRVAWTKADTETVWLAVHYPGEGD